MDSFCIDIGSSELYPLRGRAGDAATLQGENLAITPQRNMVCTLWVTVSCNVSLFLCMSMIIQKGKCDLNQKSGQLQRLSVLLVSMMIPSAFAIAGCIPAIARTFDQIPLSSVELLATIPSLSTILTVRLSNRIAMVIGAKTTISLGLFIALISGVAPCFVTNFPVVLLSRVLLGVGIGLFNSLIIQMIAEMYTGHLRSRMLGIESALEGTSGVLMTVTVGQLQRIDWQIAFSVYALALPILILFMVFVPNIANLKKVHDADKALIEASMQEYREVSYAKIAGYSFCSWWWLPAL